MNSSLAKRLLHAVVLILLCQISFAQEPVRVERSTNKVILEGQIYYIHVVKPGQTLYSISRAYGVTEKEIAIENPGVMSGIRIGQALKIPVEPTLEPEEKEEPEMPQPEPVRTHTVREGETVFRISRSYGISETALLEANPSVDANDLQPGQKLVIPSAAVPEEAFDEEGFVFHKVRRRETLYSISREYGVGVDQIRHANPELEWGGLKAGQTIRIPVEQVVDHPEVLLDTLPEDSAALAADREAPEPYEYEELRARHHDPGRTYRVAFLVPFDFREPKPLDSLIQDVKSAAARNRITERYRLEQKIPQSSNFVEFFNGALLAIDSLIQTGMKLDVTFHDTRKSPDHTRYLLGTMETDPPDLLIGPFYPFNLETVEEFCLRYHVPVATPFYSEPDLVFRNPYLFQLSPSLEREYREAAKLVASRHRYNIVYVRKEDSLDVERHDFFKELIFDGFDDYRPDEPVTFKEVVLELRQTSEIIHSLTTDRKNLVVVPTRNEALASRVVSSLYFQSEKYDIEVVGTSFWPQFYSIDYRYYHELKLIFYSTFWVDHTDSTILEYLARYRRNFYNEPQSISRKGINYGIVGYDITFYFLNAIRQHGRGFIFHLDRYDPEMVQGPYAFERVTPAGGYENTHVGFYQFRPDMTIRALVVPDPPRRRFFFRPFEDRQRRYLRHELEDIRHPDPG